MIKHIINDDFKVIVFDLNGTLTSRVSDHPEHIKYRNAFIESYLNAPIRIKLPDSTSLALNICGINPVIYYITRNTDIDWEKFHRFDPSLKQALTDLKGLGYKLVIYTDCLAEQVRATINILQIDEIIDLTLTGEYNLRKPTPRAFQFIANELECEIDELLMVGNDLNKDLLPLRYLGGNTLLLKDQKELPEFFDFIEELNHLH